MSKQVTNGYRTIVEQIDDQEVHDMIVLGSFGERNENGTQAVHAFMGDTDNLAGHVAELMIKNNDFKNIITKAVAMYMSTTIYGKCNN